MPDRNAPVAHSCAFPHSVGQHGRAHGAAGLAPSSQPGGQADELTRRAPRRDGSSSIELAAGCGCCPSSVEDDDTPLPSPKSTRWGLAICALAAVAFYGFVGLVFAYMAGMFE